MAITFIRSTTNQHSSGVYRSINFPSRVAMGDMVIAFAYSTAGSTVAPTNTHAGWVDLGTIWPYENNKSPMRAWAKINNGDAEIDNVNGDVGPFTMPDVFGGVWGAQFRGVPSATPIDSEMKAARVADGPANDRFDLDSFASGSLIVGYCRVTTFHSSPSIAVEIGTELARLTNFNIAGYAIGGPGDLTVQFGSSGGARWKQSNAVTFGDPPARRRNQAIVVMA